MEYLQYRWLTQFFAAQTVEVLNLIINGIPSILEIEDVDKEVRYSFKPYYKWNTFNTKEIISSNPNFISAF